MFEKLRGRTPGLMLEGSHTAFAVVAPYLPDEQAFLFQVRAKDLDRQPGEICFPGGKIEAGETPRQAAWREVAEELLVPECNLEVVAALDILAMPSYSVIYPFLANLRDYAGTFNTDEVETVFTVPVSFFMETEPSVHYTHVSIEPEDPAAMYALLDVEMYPWAEARSEILFYQYEDKLIWGITAKLVRHIVGLFRAVK